jgi:hypothetical protein
MNFHKKAKWDCAALNLSAILAVSWKTHEKRSHVQRFCFFPGTDGFQRLNETFSTGRDPIVTDTDHSHWWHCPEHGWIMPSLKFNPWSRSFCMTDKNVTVIDLLAKRIADVETGDIGRRETSYWSMDRIERLILHLP